MVTWRHYPISRKRREGSCEFSALEGQEIFSATLGTATLVALDTPNGCTPGTRPNQLHVRLGTDLANAPPKIVDGDSFYILVRTFCSVRTFFCG